VKPGGSEFAVCTGPSLPFAGRTPPAVTGTACDVTKSGYDSDPVALAAGDDKMTPVAGCSTAARLLLSANAAVRFESISTVIAAVMIRFTVVSFATSLDGLFRRSGDNRRVPNILD
jgi:hypothetical protein